MALVRTCDGCGQTDDHPRAIVATSMDASDDLNFHYDCVPHYIRETHPSPAYEATADGLRGAAVAAVVVDQAEQLAKEA